LSGGLVLLGSSDGIVLLAFGLHHEILYLVADDHLEVPGRTLRRKKGEEEGGRGWKKERKKGEEEGGTRRIMTDFLLRNSE
jgi:hypothetical protein